VPATGSWQVEHALAMTLVWCAVILAICVPLALRRFRSLAH
jgi:hypothetical protein